MADDGNSIVVATEARTLIEQHISDCATNYARVEQRLGRIENGIVGLLVTVLIALAGMFWQSYSSSHPPQTIVVQQPKAP